MLKKLLIHLGFLDSSLDHSQISNQIKQALIKRRIRFKVVVVISVDACGTNTAAHYLMEDSEDVKFFLLLYLSHVTSNAVKEAGFSTLSKFWGLLQKLFAHSDQENLAFFGIAQSQLKDHSSARWHSEHEVYQLMHCKHQFLEATFSQLI